MKSYYHLYALVGTILKADRVRIAVSTSIGELIKECRNGKNYVIILTESTDEPFSKPEEETLLCCPFQFTKFISIKKFTEEIEESFARKEKRV